MTHKEIVIAVYKWLKKHKRNIVVPNCSLVVSELVTVNATGEIPDVIGWNYYTSVMIEVKTSIADLRRDKTKKFKQFGNGVGEHKYYCVPVNIALIASDIITSEHGLLTINEEGKIEIYKEAKRTSANLRTERTMLLSIIRRLKGGE
jgi:Holliday junction resolvase